MNTLKGIATFLKEHTIYLKFSVLGLLGFCWIFLVAGAFLSPNRQIYTKQQLATNQTFPNGSGEIKLTSEVYSKESKQLLLSFETLDTTSKVKGLPINPEKLNWQVYSKSKSKIELQVFPVIDNKIVAIVKNLDSDFDVLAVYVENQKVNSDELQTEVKSKNDEMDIETISRDTSNDNEIYFYVLSDGQELKKKNVVDMKPLSFAINSIKDEISYQEAQIKNVNSTINVLKNDIKDIEKTIKKLKEDNQYLSQSEKSTNESKIDELESEIENKEALISQSKESIEEAKNKIKLLNKKIDDLENEELKLPKSIKGK